MTASTVVLIILALGGRRELGRAGARRCAYGVFAGHPYPRQGAVVSAAAAGERVVWVTAADRTVDHAVTSRELSAGVGGDAGGGFESVCGDRFSAAPMISEPGPTCARCARILRARASLRVIAPHRETIIGRWLSAVLPGSDAPCPGVRSARVVPSSRPRGGVA